MYHVRTSHSFMHKAIIDVVVNTVFHQNTKCNPRKEINQIIVHLLTRK